MHLLWKCDDPAESRRGCAAIDVQASSQHSAPTPLSRSDIEFIAAGSWEEPNDFIHVDLTAAVRSHRATPRYNDADDRHVGTPEDDSWDDAAGYLNGEERSHRQLAVSARARRPQQVPPQRAYGSVHLGRTGARTTRPGSKRGRVTFGGSGQTTTRF